MHLKTIFVGFLAALLSANAEASAFRLKVHGPALAAPANEDNLRFGIKTLSGYGGWPTSEAASSSLTGTDCSDFTIDSGSYLVPSGTYGATKTFAKAAEETYSCVGGSGKTYNIFMVAKAASVRWLPTDTSTTYQIRVQALKGGGTSGSLTCGDTMYLRDGESPATGIWELRPPAPSNSSWTDPACYANGPLTIRSETVDSTIDADGNPRKQHGGILRGVNVSTAVSGNIYIPLVFRDCQFNGAFTGAQIRYSSTTSGWGISVDNCRFYNTLDTVDVDGVSLVGGSDHPVFVTDSRFDGIGKAVSVGSHATAGVNLYATVSGNLCIDPKEDCWGIGQTNAPTLPGVSNPTITFNTGIGANIAAGGHPDVFQSQGIKDDSTTTLGGTFAYNLYVTSNSAFGPQYFFADDSTGSGRITNITISNNIGATTASAGIFLNRFNSPVVHGNTVVQDLQVGANNTAILVPSGAGGTGGTFNYNAVSTAQSLAAQGGTVVSTPVAVLTKSSSAYQVAMPNWYNAGIKSRRDILLAYTPADVLVADGGFKNPDGTFNGALFPACPGETIGAWNDFTVWNCSDPTWLASHPAAQ